MRSLVAPGEREHDAPDEIRAELVSTEAVARARVVAAAEWQPLLVVWYRPRQARLKPGAAAVELVF